MDAQYRKRIEEWLQWYTYNKSTTASLDQQIAFQHKCIHGLFELVVRTAEEIERVEEGHHRPKIILPVGMQLHDPVRSDSA